MLHPYIGRHRDDERRPVRFVMPHPTHQTIENITFSRRDVVFSQNRIEIVGIELRHLGDWHFVEMVANERQRIVPQIVHIEFVGEHECTYAALHALVLDPKVYTHLLQMHQSHVYRCGHDFVNIRAADVSISVVAEVNDRFHRIAGNCGEAYFHYVGVWLVDLCQQITKVRT